MERKELIGAIAFVYIFMPVMAFLMICSAAMIK